MRLPGLSSQSMEWRYFASALPSHANHRTVKQKTPTPVAKNFKLDTKRELVYTVCAFRWFSSFNMLKTDGL